MGDDVLFAVASLDKTDVRPIVLTFSPVSATRGLATSASDRGGQGSLACVQTASASGTLRTVVSVAVPAADYLGASVIGRCVTAF